MVQIALAETDQDIQKCYPVMAELRPHISFDEFLPQVKRQAKRSGFQLVYLFDEEVKAVGGFRIAEWLAGGKSLEIEDFIAKDGERSKGYGGKLFDWIVTHAKENNCDQIKLVSSVKRFDAHRFYLAKRMIIEAHYFSLNLK